MVIAAAAAAAAIVADTPCKPLNVAVVVVAAVVVVVVFVVIVVVIPLYWKDSYQKRKRTASTYCVCMCAECALHEQVNCLLSHDYTNIFFSFSFEVRT